MKSAARLIPTLSQPLRSSARPISRTLLSRCVLAGPSTSSPRLYATTSSIPPSQQTTTSNLQEAVDADLVGLDENDIPSNINFEELSEEADESINNALGYGEEFSSIPKSRFDPILLPISSLASSTPTLPSESDLVVSLPPEIFAQPIRRDILHRCVVWYLSLLRSGTKTTKSRSTVNYSGRKLRPQKGTGRARVGDASSGTRRGGAPIHPIFAKDWSQDLPRKVRALGLKIALSSKLNSGLLRIVKDLNEGEWKGTNEASRALSNQVISTSTIKSDSNIENQIDLEPIIKSSAVKEEQEQGQEPISVEKNEGEEELQVINRFGNSKDLSILFLYSPYKLHDEGLNNFKRITKNLKGIEILSIEDVQVYHILKYKWLIMEGESIDFLTGTPESLETELEILPEQLTEEESKLSA
ncbi:50S ribosomal protein L4 [Kwoniella dendrophila CBS 6074]|uniref:Large ribosomal subunit protein uL4m n=1 Tax=Kwoniella dendrophila CBS 6074 TaxID=1295534 RepID=A0AAX4JWZ7_9TREE